MDDWGSTGRHGLTVSQCVKCKHWLLNGVCKAFPSGVPTVILGNMVDHSEPFEGDHGIVFQPRDG